MHFPTEHIKRDFGRAASHYAMHADLQWQATMMLADMLSPYISNAQTVLDVGCGTGFFAEYCTSGAADIIQCDIAHAMCAQARKTGYSTVNATALALPIQSECCDAVYSGLMLQWIEDIECAFSEMARVLKPQGVIAISSFGQQTLVELKAAYNVVGGISGVSEFRSQEEIIKALSAQGFDILEQKNTLSKLRYEHPRELFAYLKNIGATHKAQTRSKGLITPAKMKALETAYSDITPDNSASWDIFYIVAKKHG